MLCTYSSLILCIFLLLFLAHIKKKSVLKKKRIKSQVIHFCIWGRLDLCWLRARLVECCICICVHKHEYDDEILSLLYDDEIYGVYWYIYWELRFYGGFWAYCYIFMRCCVIKSLMYSWVGLCYVGSFWNLIFPELIAPHDQIQFLPLMFLTKPITSPSNGIFYEGSNWAKVLLMFLFLL